MNIEKNKKAFTMVEAVLVMVVLGVISTIMITTLKPETYKKKAILSHAEKALEEIDQATDAILANDSEDGTMYNLIATDGTKFSIAEEGSQDISTKLGDLYKKYLTTASKECNSSNCKCRRMEASTIIARSAYFYLKDGTCIAINSTSGNGRIIFPGELETTTRYRDSRIRFDINDSNPPNEYGKDIFMIPLGKRGIIWDAPAVEEEDQEGD